MTQQRSRQLTRSNAAPVVGLKRRLVRVSLWACLGVASLHAANHAAYGADSNAAFLKALRDRGWDDTAVEYLEWVEASPLATPEFTGNLAFQRASSLVSQARQSRDRSERERLLNQAASDFEAFAAKQEDPTLAIDALRQAANIYAEQALVAIAESRQLSADASAERDALVAKAGTLFGKATADVKQVVDVTTKEIAALPKAAEIQSDPAAKAKRDQLRDRQVEARFLEARLAFEGAATLDRDSAEFAKQLNAASKQFGELIEEYRNSLVGMSSRFYQGRCAQDLGEYEKALSCYEDITRGDGTSAEARRLTARAHRYRTETLLELGKTDDAIKRSDEWLRQSPPAERQQPEWIEAGYRLADALQAKIAEGKLSDGDAKKMEAHARSLVREAATRPNEFRQQAQVAMATGSAGGPNGADAKTFEEAFTAGKAAIDLWNSANLAAKQAREGNPDAAGDLLEQAATNRNEARRMLEKAVALADAETPTDQLNTVRYFLSVLYWEEKQYQEAAVLAEFLVMRYPESDYAASAAKVALAAYEALALEAKSAGSQADAVSYEALKLIQLAEVVATRWPESTEASSATNALIQTALRENRLAEAEALLERLPAESRGPAQLSLGAGLWTQYLRATSANREAPAAEVLAIREKAGKLLGEGYAAAKTKGAPSASSAAGILYLAQFLLANGDAEQAIAVLEDANVGPLTLLGKGAEAAKNPQFVLETYKAALRAYLSANQPDREKAKQMMEALDKAVGADDAGKLTDVYLGLGVQLQRQMKELTTMGQPDKAAKIATAFGDVLQRISARPDANDWRVRGWIAQTNLQLGQELTGDEAKPYIDRARTAFEAMLKAATEDPKYAPSAAAVLSVRMQLAQCLLAAGEQTAAVEQFGAILKENPNVLDLQKSAAVALQQLGVQKQDVSAFNRSIQGDLPQKDGRNLIWGWQRISSVANAARMQQAKVSPVTEESRQRTLRFENLFYEARYNVAKSRYLAGKIAEPAKRREQLEAAKMNIEQMAKLYPGLGGPAWKPLFDELLKQVNQELAEKPAEKS
ncbi:hypothetical protein [Lacipirellula sp.]|uniref:hypothetical protein n=1 Tax=Lacipirellula sp. TaxID=2691419 RepID=UPI003D0AF16C